MRALFWGAHAPSRAAIGALANCPGGFKPMGPLYAGRVRGEGAANDTRGHVRSPTNNLQARAKF
ncbi:MAG: hypothetical protein DME60_02190 [Verrucomicrobia bacterium]|nr:MAG: hypothetical protein DME60_02190 [Verrucomicrobiota bacterium]